MNPLIAAAQVNSGQRSGASLMSLEMRSPAESPQTLAEQLQEQSRDVVALRAQIQALEGQQQLLVLALLAAVAVAAYLYVEG